jgi:general secretion pathway protein G
MNANTQKKIARRLARRRNRRRGMTLVEIMIVVIIMALIATAVGVAVLPALARARINQTRSDGQAVRSAVLLYLGQEPGADCPSMDELVESGTIDHSRRTTDAWDNAFSIECDGDDIIVRSNGPDGQPGTEDDVQ